MDTTKRPTKDKTKKITKESSVFQKDKKISPKLWKKQKHTYKKKPTGKNDTGRPTKYKPEYCEDIVRYFEKCQAEILVDVKFFQPNKNATISTILNPLNEEETVDAGNVKEIVQKLVMQRFPTMVRYALSIDSDEDTFLDWDKLYKDFLGARRKCKQIQEAILIENWLQGTYNSQFAMFLLKNNHWYKDRQDISAENININGWDLPPDKKAEILDRMNTLY